MKNLIFLIVAMMMCSSMAKAQGCIPIRNLIGFGQFAKPEYDALDQEPVKWLVNVNNRYFRAVHTYEGSTRLNMTPLQENEMRVYTLNISAMRMLDKGWSYAIDVPIISGSRTAWREHNVPDSTRYTTHSFGLGDVRLTVYKWLLDTSVPHRGNVQMGLGIKLPTGDYRYQDYFYKPEKVLAPVNPSIQLGDGGTGFTVEVNTFYNLNQTINLYGNLFYLFNPRDHNGVSSLTGSNPPPDAPIIKAGGNVTSVPDSYSVRGGANFSKRNVTFWSGIRMEGSPVHDVIGASNGQRRAGKIISVEPGINYRLSKSVIYAFTLVPFYKATRQTVPDKRLDRPSPGGFADYLIFVGATFKL
jgi:hypothetical protein